MYGAQCHVPPRRRSIVAPSWRCDQCESSTKAFRSISEEAIQWWMGVGLSLCEWEEEEEQEK
eukprot:CAMPEP_0175957450 /NCGR_PEP_ID=MMETSP0108-20121206/33674_1 /TAXON_ID=195067 ORGANISM="Goniomonas pacifica, Strain CCMP1869" /NCGR_SAMPLE_ID=MMETSP0108 /ASSEMBLY_ACC=CAM_ASM_000204 /LENGTH=61 /DNA_ID=CAMNT_0017284645 /DNA_START=558 /DNA_END=743 /DNA_ORIENTATION=-